MKRLFIVTLSGLLSWACPVLADNRLPTPKVSGPTQVNNRSAFSLQLSYPHISWSYQDSRHLFYRAQYWYCPPGKDTKPTKTALITEPWAGQPKICREDDNRYLGLDPKKDVSAIMVPKDSSIPYPGTWYVRARLAWVANKQNIQPEIGPWSAWHRVAVVMSFKDAVRAPKILAPKNGKLYINKDLHVRVVFPTKHANPARWEYAFEWQRADYHTNANSHYANPNPKPTDFPRVVGQASPFKAWHAPKNAHVLAESSTPSKLNLTYAELRTKRPDLSYLYRFRIREHLRGTNGNGPWPGWRSFIVSEPIQVQLIPVPLQTFHGKRK